MKYMTALAVALMSVNGCPAPNSTGGAGSGGGDGTGDGGVVLGEFVDGNPTGVAAKYATFENQPVTITLKMSAANDAAEFSVTVPPTGGTLGEITRVSDVAAECLFTPDAGFLGEAEFDFQISAGDFVSGPAHVTIRVLPSVKFRAVVEEAGASSSVVRFEVYADGDAPIPDGQYVWNISSEIASGVKSTHALFRRSLAPGNYLITLTILLAGIDNGISAIAEGAGEPLAFTLNVPRSDGSGQQKSTVDVTGIVSDRSALGIGGVRIVDSNGEILATTAQDGGYRITLPAGQNWTFAAYAEGWNFEPGSRSYENLLENLDQQNYLGDRSGSGPTIAVWPADSWSSSGFSGGPFSPTSTVYSIHNDGDAAIIWSAAADANWISVSPIGGTLGAGEARDVTVSLNAAASGLPAGSHTGTIRIRNESNGRGNTTRSVGLAVDPRPGALRVTPQAGLACSGTEGGPFLPAAKTYTLLNTGDEPIQWSATHDETWISLSQNGGVLGAGQSTSVDVAVNAAADALSVGEHADHVTFTNVTNTDGGAVREISLTAQSPSGDLAVSPGTGLTAAGNAGGPFNPTSVTYALTNTSSQTINWSVTKSGDWIHCSKTAGTLAVGASDTVSVSLNSQANGLPYGVQTAEVQFSNDTNGSGTTARSITLDINDPPTANAGGDAKVNDSDGDQSQPVALDGTASADVDGAIVNYRWMEGATELSSGANSVQAVTLGVGAHTIDLIVTDDRGGTATDQVVITVERRASSITQYGITWTFDREYRVGQFVNGDWWVIPDDPSGTVTISSVSPAPTGSGASFRNGSMINPTCSADQAYDGRNYDFNASLACAFPLSVSSGVSLVSTESIQSYPYTDICGKSISQGQACTRTAAILTCMSSAPMSTAFRPPYVGTNKPVFDAGSIDWSVLPSLPPPASAPSITAEAAVFSRPWIDHKPGWTSRSIHPADNMPNYGRELCGEVGEAACLLCCDYPIQQKLPLAYGLIQIGIDNYHSTKLNSNMWSPDGGHMIGRKFPMLFAALLLGTLDDWTLSGFSVQEDDAIYYGDTYNEMLWTGWSNDGGGVWGFGSPPNSANVMYRFLDGLDYSNPRKPYRHEHVAPSGWGSPPFPNGTLYPWDKHEPYRRTVAFALPGQTVAVRILGLRNYWNHDAYFDYVDRWMYEDDSVARETIQAAGWGDMTPHGQSAYSAFAKDMYDTYRPDY